MGLYRWTRWHKGYESAHHLEGPVVGEGDPTILLYSPLSGDYDGWKSQFPSSSLSCEAKIRCRVTSDQSLLSQAKAVVVSLEDVNRWPWSWLPAYNPDRASQVWLALWREAPWFFYATTTFNSPGSFASLDGIFNYTASYRDDADFDSSYLRSPSQETKCHWKKLPIHESHDEFSKNKSFDEESPRFEITNQEASLLAGKEDLVIWIVSHCTTVSGRERYAEQMQSTIPVTIMGLCGDQGQDQSAWSHVPGHKFYLSFENSLCDNYITEKFFRVLRDFNTVPVVLGPRKEDYLAVAPPNSFIHVSDFSSPTDLAKYLLYLDSNPSEYLKYLAWKTTHKLECLQTWACDLCSSIQKKKQKERRTINNFLTLWDNKTCYTGWNFGLGDDENV